MTAPQHTVLTRLKAGEVLFWDERTYCYRFLTGRAVSDSTARKMRREGWVARSGNYLEITPAGLAALEGANGKSLEN